VVGNKIQIKNKEMNMKRILLILVIVGLFTSCYDDFRLDNVYSSVAFSTADGGSNIPGVLHRTVVKDEGLKLDVGINLGGILENKTDRWAEFQIDPTLLDTDALKKAGYELMPASYYTLSNPSRFEIKAGSILGKVTVTLDSTKFLADPKTIGHTYVIPFRLTGTSEDTINANLSTKVVAIKYINHYEGYYDQTGTMTEFDASGNQTATSALKNVIMFSTLSVDSCVTDGILNSFNAANAMKVVVNADKTVSFSNTKGSAANQIVANGSNTYDPSTSTFSVNYKIVAKDGSYKTATAKLVWRNRIRDGINEWRR
jgi:hypothetical protein